MRSSTQLRVCRAAALGLLVPTAVIIGTPAAQAEDVLIPACVEVVSGDPSKVPPPNCVDRSGSDQDEMDFGDVENAGYMDIDGEFFDNGVNPTNGAAVIDVYTEYIDTANHNRLTEGPTYRLTFNTEVVGTQPPLEHRYQVIDGSCDPETGRTEVASSIFNPPDTVPEGMVGRYYGDLDVWLRRIPDGEGSWVPLQASKLLDGETRALGTERMLPGTYKVQLLIDDRVSRTIEPHVVVPKCGSAEPPVVNEPPVASAKPKGKLLKAKHGRRVIAVMDNRGVARATAFTVTINPPRGGGPTTRRSVRVGGDLGMVRSYRAPWRTRFSLHAALSGGRRLSLDRHVLRP